MKVNPINYQIHEPVFDLMQRIMKVIRKENSRKIPTKNRITSRRFDFHSEMVFMNVLKKIKGVSYQTD